MTALFWRFSCVCFMVVVIGCFGVVQAFDIAIYFDARSGPNWRMDNSDSLFCCCPGTTRQTVLSNIGANNEQQVFDWFRDMGVNYIVTYYPFGGDLQDLHARDLHGMKILNDSYPDTAFKYLEAQYRDVFVGDREDKYVNDDNSSWGPGAVGRYNDTLHVYVLQMQQSLATTMWRPQSELGAWTGWDRREARMSGNVYMPMHFRILCNLVPTDPPPPANRPIAEFCWIVKNTNGPGWWRYPAHVFRAGDFTTGPDSLDQIEFTIDPSPAGGNVFGLLNDDFSPTIPTESADRHSFDSGSLDETSSSHSYGGWAVPVRMSMYYEGDNQTFQIYEISVWDEGYHRLWVSADTTAFFSALRSAFSYQHDFTGDSLFAGWYFDEWIQPEQLKSFVKVNKIIAGTVTNTMFINGQPGYDNCSACYRNQLFEQMSQQSVSLNVHMDEFYIYGGARAYSPIIRYMYTDTSSEGPYFNPLGSHPADQTVLATQSLQAAIDERLWGEVPVADAYSLPINRDNVQHLSLLDQIAFVHEDPNRKFWAMIQGDDDDPNDSASCCWIIRQPTPNEVKLSAWLAVACNADGILWYPVKFAAGLLRWYPDMADQCGGLDNLANRPIDSVGTTDRYLAAKKVGNDIQYIAPILDGLEFVKTYASRAFETNYPNATYAATALDTLANVTWCANDRRAVQAIRSYALE
jgi:hypothetical protein